MTVSDGMLERAVIVCQRYENWCAVAVLLGFVVGAGFVIVHPSVAAPSGTILAAMLIAAGILGELWFSARGARVHSELMRRSRQRLADAIKLAADAGTQAAQARLEAERLRAQLGWRRISRVQAAILARFLSGTRGPLVISHVSGDLESTSYAWQFLAAFRNVGWTVSVRAATFPQPEFGVKVPDAGAESVLLLRNLRSALTAACIEFDTEFPAGAREVAVRTFGPTAKGIALPPQDHAVSPVILCVGSKPMTWSTSDEEAIEPERR